MEYTLFRYFRQAMNQALKECLTSFKPAKNIPAFNVTCEFGSGYGKASISPIYENEFQYTSIPGGSDGCADPGCYQDNISYNVAKDQIEALVSVSQFCEQTIQNNCTLNTLTGFAWWLDRNGNKMQYWHGAGNETTLGCQCSLTNSCDSRYN